MARHGATSDRELQRAEGAGRVVLSGSDGGTRIVDVFQRSPIRFMFPRTGGSALQEAVLVNTAGGIAGGDRLECAVTAGEGAEIVVTTQAAEKVYGALDEPARVSTTLTASGAAKLAWCPQETIMFNRGRLRRQTDIDVSSGAEVLGLECVVLGRAAHGEVMLSGDIADSWRVTKDGRLMWADCFRVTDAIFPHLHRTALLSRCNAVGTLICCGRSPDTWLECIRDIVPSLGCHCAATLVREIVIARFAAAVPSDLRLALRSVLDQCSRALGPGPFRVPKMWSC